MGHPITYNRWYYSLTEEQLNEWLENDVDLWEEYEAYCADYCDYAYEQEKDRRLFEGDD